MIHELLHLERNLFVLDLETTGVDPLTARIIEIGFQQFNAEGLVKEWQTFIDPGIPIPSDATRVNKITDDDVKEKPTFKQLSENLAKGFRDCDFAGKNVRYDLRVLSAEMKRAGLEEWNYLDARILDADRLEQLGEPRTLSHLYERHTGKKLEGAHRALVDVQATTDVINAQLVKFQHLPKTLDALHELQWPGYIDDDGRFKFVGGVPTCSFGKWRGKAMRDIPMDYWDWIIRSDFPSEVKGLANAAKLGKYPTKKG